MAEASKKQKPKSAESYEQELGELTATLQRVQADFENFKKRVAAEREELMNSAKLSVLTDLLPALDNFDRAATHLPKELENNSWAQGMSYVGTQLEQILTDMGVKKFDMTGEVFDESRAEALEHIESDKPEGTVVEQITPGYEIADRVVRPAIVKVSKHKQSSKKGDK